MMVGPSVASCILKRTLEGDSAYERPPSTRDWIAVLVEDDPFAGAKVGLI